VHGIARVSGAWPDKPSSSQGSATDFAPMAKGQASAGHSSTLGWALAAAFLGGLILNLMPCVFPILAIKALGLANPTSHRGSSPGVIGLAYTAGVVVSMALLGGALLSLRAGGEQLGWGFQLQSPTVITALAVLFTLIVLNLVGLLEWGTLAPSGLAGLQLRHPAADAALSGVLAVAVASPCTAPFMGASLGLALTLPAWQAMGIFISLGLGLALPFALLSSAPQFARWLPKPGAWMQHLRQFMAFPIAATVLWLLWVLGHILGMDAAASLAALLWALALCVWALGLKGISRWSFSLIALAVTLALLRMVGPQVLKSHAPELNSQGISMSEPTANAWQTWNPQRVQDELANGHPVFVDFTAAWCVTCKYNEQTTLSNLAVLEDFSNKHVTLLRADWTRRDSAITQVLTTLGRSGVPAYVLYRPGKPPQVLSEILTPGELKAALQW